MKNERKTLKNVLKWPKPKAQTGHPGAKMVPLPYEIKKKQKKQKSEKNKKMKIREKSKKKISPPDSNNQMTESTLVPRLRAYFVI